MIRESQDHKWQQNGNGHTFADNKSAHFRFATTLRQSRLAGLGERLEKIRLRVGNCGPARKFLDGLCLNRGCRLCWLNRFNWRLWNRVLNCHRGRRWHHPRRTRDSGRPHLNHILRRHWGRVRNLLSAVVGDWSRIHCRCAHVPTDLWFQCRRKRHLPDRDLRDPRRRRTHPAKRWIGRGSRRFAADGFGIFPANHRSRLRLRTRQWHNRRPWPCLERYRCRLFLLRFARRHNRAREMIGETVRFARDQRHGLRDADQSLAILNFPVNLNVNACMRLPPFEATLTSDRRDLTARDHSSRHGLLLRGH